VDFAWMDDTRVFHPVTSALLNEIYLCHQYYDNRYVMRREESGEAYFPTEKPYADMDDPSEDYKLLALFRFWNIIQYFFPYRSLADADWDAVLKTFISKVMATRTALDYHLAMAELTSFLNDGHAMAASQRLDDLWGTNWAPARARWVEGRMVVVKTLPALLEAADLRTGDIITALDGVPVEDLRRDRRKYISASNEPFLDQRLCWFLLRSRTGSLTLSLDRFGAAVEVRIPCHPRATVDNAETAALPAPAYSLRQGSVGYAHLKALQADEVAEMFDLFSETAGIVFDLRNVPGPTLYEICKFIYPKLLEFARPLTPSMRFPGKFELVLPAFMAGPGVPSDASYRGRVVIVVDEDTISRGEFTTMALRAAPGAVVVGARTAGADGNVSTFELPGGITVKFTGTSSIYYNHYQTQRNGILPDIVVRPTLEGLRAGRDECLERAFDYARTGH
jgi:C-terminal processing protease CtpA/Prc